MHQGGQVQGSLKTRWPTCATTLTGSVSILIRAGPAVGLSKATVGGATQTGKGGAYCPAYLPRAARVGHLPTKLSVYHVPSFRRHGGQRWSGYVLQYQALRYSEHHFKSKPQETATQKVFEILALQGIACANCPKLC